jgi:putative redox protein
MKIKTVWEEKLRFKATAGEHSALMDTVAPLSTDKALSPKQLLLAAVTGCTAMDVAAHMRKHKQEMQEFYIEADAPTTEGSYPVIFKEVHLEFHLSGKIDPKVAIEAVELSETKYCGVSAMISKAVPIRFTVFVNGANVHQGTAKFNI